VFGHVFLVGVGVHSPEFLGVMQFESLVFILGVGVLGSLHVPFLVDISDLVLLMSTVHKSLLCRGIGSVPMLWDILISSSLSMKYSLGPFWLGV